MVQSRLVAVVLGAAAATGVVNFVAPLSAPRTPGVGLAAQGDAGSFASLTQGAEFDAAPDAQEATSPWKWLAAGLAAGIVAAASSAPAEAKLPTGPEWDLATTAKAPWLQPCKDNKKYHKKFKDAIYKLTTRQKKYTTGGVIAKRFDLEIAQTKRVEEAYGNRLCGKADGTPRTIASGENVRGSIVIPGLMFLYTAGWIGWAGRSYLNRTKSAEKEMFIEIPLALTCMASGFAWPVNAWQEIVNGQMTVPDSELYQSGQAAKGDY
mmetsp:Transcript_17163/g.47314  ORF Transcript_17163/g.47314 Transcript_17163/m.47314 type:complete len:265 (-) Transcript_17163:105-899(-)